MPGRHPSRRPSHLARHGFEATCGAETAHQCGGRATLDLTTVKRRDELRNDVPVKNDEFHGSS